MNPLLDLPLLRKLRISMASALLRGADVELVFELRQVRTDSRRDIVGRRIARVDSIEEAREVYDATPIPAGYHHDLSIVGLVARSAPNIAILEKAKPPKHEPERHTAKPFSTDEQLPATLDGPDPLKGSTPATTKLDPMVAALVRPEPISALILPGNDDLEDKPQQSSLNYGTDEAGGLIIDDSGPVPARAWSDMDDNVKLAAKPDLRYANGHDHDQLGPLKANRAGVYTPSCSKCGEPQG